MSFNVDEIKKAIAEAVSQSITETVPTMVKEQIEEQLKALGLDEVARKNIFGDKSEEVKDLEGKEKIAKFIGAVTRKDEALIKALVGEKAMTEGTSTAGGYLVPEEFQAEVVRLAEDYGLVRAMARIIPMKSDTRNIPRLSSSVTVYWPGENTAGTVSQPAFGQVQLIAKTAVGLTVISNELLEDSDPSVVDLLVELFAEALAGEEDKQGLVGSGSPFTGVLNDTNVAVLSMGTGNTAFSNVTADDLRDLIAQLKPLALKGAGFILHRSVWAIVQKLKDSNGQYIASTANPVVSGDANRQTAAVGAIWGYPVYLSEQMPSTSAANTKFIIFGNLRHLFLGDRKQMTLSVSDSATVGSDNVFEQNSSAVRVTERIAIAVGLPQAFAVLKTSAT